MINLTEKTKTVWFAFILFLGWLASGIIHHRFITIFNSCSSMWKTSKKKTYKNKWMAIKIITLFICYTHAFGQAHYYCLLTQRPLYRWKMEAFKSTLWNVATNVTFLCARMALLRIPFFFFLLAFIAQNEPKWKTNWPSWQSVWRSLWWVPERNMRNCWFLLSGLAFRTSSRSHGKTMSEGEMEFFSPEQIYFY